MADLTPNGIVRKLVELSALLDKATAEIEQLDELAVRARALHRVTYARTFVTCGGAMDMRTQVALLAAEIEWLDMELADQKVRACKERIRTLRDQIEIHRSLSAAVRAEWAAAGHINLHP